MLVPHRREDAEFRERRHAPDQLEDTLILVRFETVASDEFGGDLRIVRSHVTSSPVSHLCSLSPCGGGLGRGLNRKCRRLYPPLQLSPTRGERAHLSAPIDCCSTSPKTHFACVGRLL